MKICFLMISHWSGDLGGAELQVKYIMEYLVQHTNHEAQYICWKSKMEEEFGIKIQKTNAPYFLAKRFKAANFLSIIKILEKNTPDVVYTRVSSPFVGAAAYYCKKHNKKLIYHIAHIEDVTPYKIKNPKQLYKFLERPLYVYGLKKANVIIGQAAYQDELINKHYGLSCTAIIPNFHPIPKKVAKEGDICHVAWVANIKKAKNPDIFLALARQLQNEKKIHFHMVGQIQGNDYPGFLEEVKQIANFTYYGHQPVEKVNALLEKCSLFVNTSSKDQEGFPNTFIQAWLREVPVVSLYVDPDDIIKGHRLGEVSGNLDTMVKQVIQLATNCSLRKSMGEKAREYAISHFSIENCEKLIGFFD